MKTLLRITFLKIKRNIKKSIFQSIATFISMFVISFLLCFIVSIKAFGAANPTFGIETVNGESMLTVESLRKFMSDIISGISLIAGAIAVLSFASLFIYSRLRTEENKRFFATLTSIGATGSQRRIVSITETIVLFGIPIFSGSFLGMLPSRLFSDMVARIFVSDYTASPISILTPAVIAVLGTALVLIFTYVPSIKRKKSVIEAVKAHNAKESDATHNYRNSYTFRHMPIEQRIAKKSVAYYSSTYRRIAFMFVCCVLYPILAIAFFLLVSEASVIDYTPNCGIDIAKLIEIFVKNIAIFGVSAFLALTVFAVFQTMYIMQAHSRIRKETLMIYKSIGMTENSIKKVLKYEHKTAFSHAAICLICLLIFAFVGISRF